MLFVIIISFFCYYKLFILGYFQLCENIIGYFWILKAISPYVIISNSILL
jgi:hypothetical protein